MTDAITDAAHRILALVEAVRDDEKRIGVFSTGEKIAVALVLDRPDLLEWGTVLESVERLGPDWLRAALLVQRSVPEDWYRKRRHAA